MVNKKKIILSKKYLIKEYIKKDKTCKQISLKIGCSCETVRKELLRNNIKRKNPSHYGGYWTDKKRYPETIEKIKIARAKQILPKRTAESNKKIGDAQRGEKNHNYGKKASAKSREKMSLAKKGMKGKPLSESTKQKIRDANLGKVLSDETKKKIKIALNKPERIKNFKEKRKNWTCPKKDTSIEIKIQNFLSKLHLEYFTHKYISEIKYKYQCDVFIPVQKGIPQKTIIECDGDYWHGNPKFPRARNFDSKRKSQRCLDFERTSQLEKQGFRVIRLFGSEIIPMKLNGFKEIFK